MNNIDIKKLKNIKEDLDTLKNDDVLYVEDNGVTKYVIMTSTMFDSLEEILNFKDDDGALTDNVRIINADKIELSYDEYEKVKEQILNAFDKTFKPKPEKLN